MSWQRIDIEVIERIENGWPGESDLTETKWREGRPMIDSKVPTSLGCPAADLNVKNIGNCSCIDILEDR